MLTTPQATDILTLFGTLYNGLYCRSILTVPIWSRATAMCKAVFPPWKENNRIYKRYLKGLFNQHAVVFNLLQEPLYFSVYENINTAYYFTGLSRMQIYVNSEKYIRDTKLLAINAYWIKFQWVHTIKLLLFGTCVKWRLSDSLQNKYGIKMNMTL